MSLLYTAYVTDQAKMNTFFVLFYLVWAALNSYFWTSSQELHLRHILRKNANITEVNLLLILFKRHHLSLGGVEALQQGLVEGRPAAQSH